MYYNRTVESSFAALLEEGGELRWLFDYVRTNLDLDFLIGKVDSKEWISIYRGLTRITTLKRLIKRPNYLTVDAAQSYQKLSPELFGTKLITDLSIEPIETIRKHLEAKGSGDRYFGNKKEGYYQNKISRKYGLDAAANAEFLVLDKEVVVGYACKGEKEKLFGPLQTSYKKIQKIISNQNPKRYGQNRSKEPVGNELDFLGLHKSGDIWLIELKDGSNTSGIYLSPLQIGLYHEVFSKLPFNQLEDAVLSMLEQKQKIGLLPANWQAPKLSGNIIPVLVVANYRQRSSAQEKFWEIMSICRENKGQDFLKDIKIYASSTTGGFEPL